MDKMQFLMLTALFVHTFFNFLTGVWASFKAQVAGAKTEVTSVEDFVAHIWKSITSLFKKL